MTPTCPKCHGTDLQIIQNETLGMFVFCKTKGCHTYPVLTDTNSSLHDTLVRYEGAVSAVERDGDDSDAAVGELAAARTALLNLLRAARTKLEG